MKRPGSSRGAGSLHVTVCPTSAHYRNVMSPLLLEYVVVVVTFVLQVFVLSRQEPTW
jgi:hypothetical protein